MTNYATSGSPLAIFLGTDDRSIPKIYPREIPQPQALLKFYFYGEKGSTKPELLGAGEAVAMYGADTFDKSKPYFNHATHYINYVGGLGTSMMLQRLVPEDAGVKANLTIFLDVLSTDVPNYERNSDGSIATDVNGDKITNAGTPTIPGYLVKIITESHDTEDPTITIKAGTQDGGASSLYPIMTYRGSEKGKAYNSYGIGIEVQDPLEVDPKVIQGTKGLTYNLFRYVKSVGSTEVNRTKYGEEAGRFSFVPRVVNPLTEAQFDLPIVMDNEWSNDTNPLIKLMYNDFEDIVVYEDNIKTLTDLFVDSEKDYINDTSVTWHDGLDNTTSAWFDFFSTGDDIVTNGEEYLFNIIGFRSMSSKSPYFSVQLDDTIPTLAGTQKEVQLSRLTPVFLEQGSSGDMSDANFNLQVQTEMEKYVDLDSTVMDMAVNVESMFVDTGFDLETKKSLVNFITYRKDTFLFLTPHYHSNDYQSYSLSDSRALTSTLLTRMRLAPESTYHGTPVMRGAIVNGDGKMINRNVQYQVSQVLELIGKVVKMMGAGDGSWKQEFLFDTFANEPGNALTELEDIRPDSIPNTIKPLLFKEGMIWSQSANRRTYHFPATQTVYDNDFSVLNGIYAPLAICTIVKKANDAHIAYTGDMSSTRAVFAQRIKTFLDNRLQGKFASIFTITNEVVFSEYDKRVGYSWHVISKIYAPSMKTVQTHETQAYRYNDPSNSATTA